MDADSFNRRMRVHLSSSENAEPLSLDTRFQQPSEGTVGKGSQHLSFASQLNFGCSCHWVWFTSTRRLSTTSSIEELSVIAWFHDERVKHFVTRTMTVTSPRRCIWAYGGSEGVGERPLIMCGEPAEYSAHQALLEGGEDGLDEGGLEKPRGLPVAHRTLTEHRR